MYGDALETAVSQQDCMSSSGTILLNASDTTVKSNLLFVSQFLGTSVNISEKGGLSGLCLQVWLEVLSLADFKL